MLRILGFLVFGFSSIVWAEPWLASRYVQNCAACHAPGRVNVAPSHRRCTVSCQGCHTNPNGGGLRNFYGKWLEQRWLNSAYFRGYKLNKPRPMPTKDQWYADDRLKSIANNPQMKRKVAGVGYKLRQTSTFLPEDRYDRRSTQERFVEPDPYLTLARIPEDDPWRERRLNFFNAGIDSRFFYMDEKIDGPAPSMIKNNGAPMANDLGVSFEPVHRFTGVLEARFLNDPRNSPAWENGFSSSQVRSAYLMVDDLPYNTYVMYGLYRPMFGNYEADHTNLMSKASGLDQYTVMRAFTVGTAPNVPFLNLHVIQPMDTAYALDQFSQDKGFAVNLGARFVSYGAYAMLSYWDTSSTATTGGVSTTTNKVMSSATGGFTVKRDTVVFDVTRLQREVVGQNKNAGTCLTLENRFRFWRENYFKTIYENLNTARDLTVGSAQGWTVGVNAFLVSGLEVEALYRDYKENTNGAVGDEKATWVQLHLFF